MINKKAFFGGLNSDDADILVPKNDYIGALNVRVTSGETGDVGMVSTLKGNVIKRATLGSPDLQMPDGVNETIGSAISNQDRRVLFFNWNSLGTHGIYCYDTNTDLVYVVLEDRAPYTSGSLLKFSRGKFIHSAAVIDGKLYWTDDENQPRRINIDAGIKMFHPQYQTTVKPYLNGIDESVISLIRNPPALPVLVQKQNNSFVNNFIQDGAFQFAYRFVYRDNEESVFGPYSELMNFNTKKDDDDLYNSIVVTLPFEQKIGQDVQRVEFAVKNMVGESLFIIQSYEVGIDDTEINNHNNQVSRISFVFLNNTRGLPVDGPSMVEPFDNVPLRSKTLALAKNRVFLGNNLYGYDSPASTSLSLAAVQDQNGSSTLNGLWWRLVYSFNQTQAYFLEIRGIAQSGFYIGAATQPPFPTSVAWNNLTYVGPNFQSILTYLGLTYQDMTGGSFGPTGDQTTITGPPTITAINSRRIFKSDSTYRAAIVFYDQSRRKCGAVPAAQEVITPDRNLSNIALTESLRWGLSNANPSEIPTWATHYSICLTKSLRTNSFVQQKADEVTYIKKDPLTGEYSTIGTYASTHFGFAVKISSLNAAGLGYQFQEGDLMKLYKDGERITVKVKDQWSEWVIGDLVNWGSVGVWEVLYEIYSPEQKNFSEIFYEQGNAYPILNPGTANRSYSVITGDLKGDVYILERKKGATTYQAEAMSPKDTFWRLWYTSASRENVVIRGTTQRSTLDICYSNTISVGSRVNGLSSFEVLNSSQVPSELGGINRLILANKVQGEGSVMLAVGNTETVSIYIGESQLFDGSGNSFLAKSDNVIGQINALAGGYGTLHPESAFLAKRDIYFYDSGRSAWVRYNVNGLFPVSNYKMRKFFNSLSSDIRKYYLDPSEYALANGQYPLRVLGCEDPYTDEVLFCFPKFKNLRSGVTLVDLPNVDAYYEPYDAQGGTLALQPRSDRFSTFYSFKPDWITYMGGRLVSFKEGRPWVHDEGDTNRFYGEVYDSVIAGVHSDSGNSIKTYLALAIEGDEPDHVHIRVEKPNLQSTDIRKGEFGIKEGVLYSAIPRDRLSPNSFGSYDDKQFRGDRMRGELCKFQVVFSAPTVRKTMKFVNINFVPSRGHNV